MKNIPEAWIKEYVDKLIAAAKLYPPENKLHQALLERADAIMDMVKEWRQSK